MSEKTGMHTIGLKGTLSLLENFRYMKLGCLVSTESIRNTIEISILWDYIRFVNELNINPLLYLNLPAMVIIWKVEFDYGLWELLIFPPLN